MQPYSSLPSRSGPIITGTGYGGLFGIVVLFLILIPAALVYHPADSGRARPTAAYVPCGPAQAAILHPGISHYQAKILPGLDRTLYVGSGYASAASPDPR